MAWKDEGTHYTWDVTYTKWSSAATRAGSLAREYKIFTDTITYMDENGDITSIEIITHNTIHEEHSIACRCEKCVPL